MVGTAVMAPEEMVDFQYKNIKECLETIMYLTFY
jgi:hypothetical protein